jgi:F-type H+-transporting ATPase subunit delta
MNTDTTEILRERARPHTVLDDEGRHAAHVYAESLFRAAGSPHRVNELLGECGALVDDIFARSPELELIFASAAISRERKEELINRIFGGRSSDQFVNFLKVVNAHNRLDLLRAIVEAYRNLVKERGGKIIVEVRSAVPLSDEQKGKLWHTLRDVSGREPELRESIDASLLGGLVVQVGDWVYDASVRTKIEAIRMHLIERSSHGIPS